MINVNELRIGNKVQRYSETLKGWVNFTIQSAKDLVDIEKKDIDVEPIPLTEERLLEFGFKICAKYPIYTNWKSNNDSLNDMGFTLHSSKEYSVSFSIWDHECFNIKYVHTLQNLYFAFTEEELPTN